MARKLSFVLLGPVSAEVGGRAVPLGGARQRAVLAALLLSIGKRVDAEDLVELVWGEDPPRTGRTSLQNAISKLRAELANAGASGAIRTDGSGYVLDVDPEALDLVRFERLAEDGRAAAAVGDHAHAAALLEAALDLWRGQPLDGVELLGLPPGDRQAWVRRRDDVRIARLEVALELGDIGKSLSDLEELRRSDPLDERVAELTAKALARSGRPADALATIAELRRALAVELGMDPGLAIQALEQAIVSGDAAIVGATHGPADDAPRDVRRILTVLAAKPGGGLMDPEAELAARRRLHAVAERLATELDATLIDGSPSVVVVFGLSRPHEDDPARALRASAALVEEERCRVGLATVEELVHEDSGSWTLLSGNALELAGSLAAAAAPGEVWIEDGTLLASGTSEAGLSPRRVALASEYGRRSVYSWDAAGGLPIPTARSKSPFVARASELDLLLQAWETSVESGARMVTVVGPAGIGKSRLVREFLHRLGSGIRRSEARCLPYGRDISTWPIRELVRDLAGIGENDPARRALARVHASLGGESDVDRGQLAAVLGLEDHPVLASDLQWALRRLLEVTSASSPLVVVFDDLQWADDSFLDLVEYVASTSRQTGLMIVAVARSELIERRRTFGGRAGSVIRWLDPLPDDAARELVARLIPPDRERDLSEDIRAAIVERAEGNPLYLGELLRALMDRTTAGSDDRGSAVGAADLLPVSVRALLEARLDRLTARERGMLEVAAIVGKEFSLADLRDLRPELRPEELTASLDALCRLEMVHLERTARADRVYRFHHILLRDVTEAATPKMARARDHERFGDALELRAGDRLAEVEEIVGYHLETAWSMSRDLGIDEDRTLSIGTRAATRLSAAGRRASARDDMVAAESLLERALGCLPSEHPSRAELSWVRAAALYHLGRFTDADEQARDGLVAAVGNDGLGWRLRMVRETVGLYHRPEDHPPEHVRTVIDSATAAFLEHSDEAGVALAKRLWADALMQSGRLEEAVAVYRESAVLAARAGEEIEPLPEPVSGMELHGRDPLPLFIARAEAAIAGTRARRPETDARLGLAYAMSGRFDEAWATFDRAMARLGEIGSPFRMADAKMLVGAARLYAGDARGAAEVLEEADVELDRLGERGIRSTVLSMLAEARFRLGDDTSAEGATRVSESLTPEEDAASAMGWRQVRAKLLVRSGRLADALELLDEATEIGERTDFVALTAIAHADLAWALDAAGRAEEAQRARERAAELFAAKGVAAISSRPWLEAPPVMSRRAGT